MSAPNSLLRIKEPRLLVALSAVDQLKKTTGMLILLLAFSVLVSPWIGKQFLQSYVNNVVQTQGTAYVDQLAQKIATHTALQQRRVNEIRPNDQGNVADDLLNLDSMSYSVVVLDVDQNILEQSSKWGDFDGLDPWAKALIDFATLRSDMSASSIMTPIFTFQGRKTSLLVVPFKTSPPSNFAYAVFFMDTETWLPSKNSILAPENVTIELIEYTPSNQTNKLKNIINYPGWSGLWSIKVEHRYLSETLINTIPQILFVATLMGILLVTLHFKHMRRVEEIHLKLEDKSKQLERLEQMSLLGEVSTSLAHEINQPLAAINNYAAVATMAAKQSNNQEPIIQALQKIQEQTQRAAKIILAVKGMIGHNDIIKESVFDPVIILIETVETLKYKAEQLNIILSLDAQKGATKINSSETLLELVISNLIRNAMESYDGTSSPNKEINIKAFNNNGFFFVEISDNGIGIPEDIQKNIFNPFFSTKKTGMGIGLAFCKTSMERIGGDVRLMKSTPNGTSMQIVVPTKIPTTAHQS